MSLDHKNTLYIPQSAIVQRGQLSGIYTLTDDNKAILRWIRTGDISGDKIEVLSGLKEGEPFVASAEQPIRQGQLLSTE